MFTDYQTGARLIQTHQCVSCGDRSALVCRWNSGESRYEVRCPRCGEDAHFVQPKSLTAMWRENPDSVPVHVADKLARKYGGRPMDTTAITTAEPKAMAQRMQTARWLKELSDQDRRSLADLAVRYGLDPVMRELTLYEGAPYITLAGYLRIAHRQPEFEGLEDEPMTDEQRKLYGIKAPIGWLTKIYRRGWRAPVKGIGTADPQNPRRGNAIERTDPQTMARSRSIRQALRTAFPHSLPWREVDEETGEVTTGDAGLGADVVEAEIVQAVPVEATPSNGHETTPAPVSAPKSANPDDPDAFPDILEPCPERTRQVYRDWHMALRTAANLAEFEDVVGRLKAGWSTIPTVLKDALKAYRDERREWLMGDDEQAEATPDEGETGAEMFDREVTGQGR